MPVTSELRRSKSRGESFENDSKESSRTTQSGGKKDQMIKSRRAKKEPLSPQAKHSDASDYSSQLTKEDIEKIRGISQPRKQSDSEFSGSSRISHPDPVKYNINPAEYVLGKGGEDPMFCSMDLFDENDDLCNSETDVSKVMYPSNGVDEGVSSSYDQHFDQGNSEQSLGSQQFSPEFSDYGTQDRNETYANQNISDHGRKDFDNKDKEISSNQCNIETSEFEENHGGANSESACSRW